MRIDELVPINQSTRVPTRPRAVVLAHGLNIVLTEFGAKNEGRDLKLAWLKHVAIKTSFPKLTTAVLLKISATNLTSTTSC
mmetsp:Transcript_21352/g.44544  ORF Transcript_21352/g.44544 Transcript_21352/m.44544 type:complete len:81 (-) Transcript_21352:767-1009(-)